MGAEPGALVGGDLALDAGEEFGGGRSESMTSTSVAPGVSASEFADEVGFEALQALLLPVGADHAVDEEAVDDVSGG